MRILPIDSLTTMECCHEIRHSEGDAYYVFQGVTKTGKPKYDVSRKAEFVAGSQLDDSERKGRGRCIVIYESVRAEEPKSMASVFGGLTLRFAEAMQYSSPMSPAFRFKLIRKKERVFEAQRFCFRGGIDDWIRLHHEGTLDELCQYYLKHLGKEFFYKLM